MLKLPIAVLAYVLWGHPIKRLALLQVKVSESWLQSELPKQMSSRSQLTPTMPAPAEASHSNSATSNLFMSCGRLRLE